MEDDGNREQELRLEAWRKLNQIAGDFLDQTSQFSFTYGDKPVQAKYKTLDMNYNGRQVVILTTTTGELLYIRTKDFFNLPEVKNLLKSRLNASDLDSTTFQMASDILDKQGVEF